VDASGHESRPPSVKRPRVVRTDMALRRPCTTREMVVSLTSERFCARQAGDGQRRSRQSALSRIDAPSGAPARWTAAPGTPSDTR
jgi:hypothetical protein